MAWTLGWLFPRYRHFHGYFILFQGVYVLPCSHVKKWTPVLLSLLDTDPFSIWVKLFWLIFGALLASSQDLLQLSCTLFPYHSSQPSQPFSSQTKSTWTSEANTVFSPLTQRPPSVYDRHILSNQRGGGSFWVPFFWMKRRLPGGTAARYGFPSGFSCSHGFEAFQAGGCQLVWCFWLLPCGTLACDMWSKIPTLRNERPMNSSEEEEGCSL